MRIKGTNKFEVGQKVIVVFDKVNEAWAIDHLEGDDFTILEILGEDANEREVGCVYVLDNEFYVPEVSLFLVE